MVASPQPSVALTDVAVTATDAAWAVGTVYGCHDRGCATSYVNIHWDGQTWTYVPAPIWDMAALTSISMLSATDGWGVGVYQLNECVPQGGCFREHYGVIARWQADVGQWTIVSGRDGALPPLRTVAMGSATAGWIIGDGIILRWDGQSWTRYHRPVEANVLAMQMLSATEGWAVGYGGTILFWDGELWRREASPTTSMLTAISMASSTDGWAIGRDQWGQGMLLRYSVP